MNWGTMKQTATGFIHRKDINWDEIQPLACDEISQALTVQENEGFSAIPLELLPDWTINSGPLPADWARARAVMVGGRDLDPIDIKTLLAGSWRDWKYAISGGRIVANKTGPLTVVYSTRIKPVAGDTESNVVLDKYSPVYLYGLLKHAALKTQDFDAGDKWAAQFDLVIGAANSTYMDAAFGPGMAPIAPGGTV